MDTLFTIGFFLFVGFLVVKLHPYSPEEMRRKRNALIDKAYRDHFDE